MEADLRSEYGVDLEDLYTRRITLRKMLVYVDGLCVKRSSRIVVAMNGATGPYDQKDWFLMDVIDLLNLTVYFSSMSAAAGVGKEFAKLAKKAPKPIARPGDQPKKIRFATKEDLKQMFGG